RTPRRLKVSAKHYEVVAIAHETVVASEQFLVKLIEEEIGKQRRDGCALRQAALSFDDRLLEDDRGLHPLFDQRDERLERKEGFELREHTLPLNRVEERLDVGVEDVAVAVLIRALDGARRA